MALSSLTVEEMVEVSEGWLTPGAARQALLSSPTIAAVLPHVDVAHRQLVGLAHSESGPRCHELLEHAAVWDGVEARLVRGIAGLLTELALLVDGGESLLLLRDGLTPESLEVTREKCAMDPSGRAATIRGRLTPKLREQLNAVSVPGGTLLERMLAWLDASDRLGKREQDAGEEYIRRAGAILAARAAWVLAVEALRAMAALDRRNSERDQLIFGLLDSAESSADVRGARSVAAALAGGQAARVSDVAPAPLARARGRAG